MWKDVCKSDWLRLSISVRDGIVIVTPALHLNTVVRIVHFGRTEPYIACVLSKEYRFNLLDPLASLPFKVFDCTFRDQCKVQNTLNVKDMDETHKR